MEGLLIRVPCRSGADRYGIVLDQLGDPDFCRSRDSHNRILCDEAVSLLRRRYYINVRHKNVSATVVFDGYFRHFIKCGDSTVFLGCIDRYLDGCATKENGAIATFYKVAEISVKNDGSADIF